MEGKKGSLFWRPWKDACFTIQDSVVLDKSGSSDFALSFILCNITQFYVARVVIGEVSPLQHVANNNTLM
jgi:hypothetical protein